MEEVWKDITTLTSSYHGRPSNAPVAQHESSVHDFLTSPIVSPPTQRCDDTNGKNAVSDSDHINSGSFTCSQSQSSPTLSSIFASSVFPSKCCQKRDSEDDNNGCFDRKYKRKMKNRESATRSRARRQAYTNELELEVAHLREENAMLRRRQEEMTSAAAAAAATVAQVPKKTTLLRSLTAPF